MQVYYQVAVPCKGRGVIAAAAVDGIADIKSQAVIAHPAVQNIGASPAIKAIIIIAAIQLVGKGAAQ